MHHRQTPVLTMPKPLAEVKARIQTWPNGKEMIPEKDFKVTQGLLLLLPQFFNEIETWRKTYKYRNHLFPDGQKMWLVNTKTNEITYMIEVGSGEEHSDKRLDGSLRRKYRYPILACYKLNQTLPWCSKVLIKGFETVIRNPADDLAKIWVIRDDCL